MADYTIFGTGDPTGMTLSADDAAVTVGTWFYTTGAERYIKGVRIWLGPDAVLTTGYVAALYAETGDDPIDLAQFGEMTLGWNEADFQAPIQLSDTTQYLAAVFVPNGSLYVSSAALFGSGDVPSGNDPTVLFASDRATSGIGDNGLDVTADAMNRPTEGLAGHWAGVDVTVTDSTASDTTLVPLTYGAVVGRFLAIVADTNVDPDVDPDAIAMVGTINFTPTVRWLQVISAVPVAATVFPGEFQVAIDAQGYLAQINPSDGTATRGIELLATDDASVNPTDYEWKAEFDLSIADVSVDFPAFYFKLPAGTTVDLTTLAPVEISGGVQITRGETGAGVATGGTSGQVLAKASSEDFDTHWVNQSGGGGGDITSADITDATTVGKGVLTAASMAAARTAIGAGTSSLALGTGSTTAKAGDYAPAAADISDATTVGKALIKASAAAAGQIALGGTTTGRSIFTAGNAAAAFAALDASSPMNNLYTATNAAQVVTSLGGGLGLRTALGVYSQTETDAADATKVNADLAAGVNTIWVGTTADYDSVDPKDPGTLYFTTD